MTIDFAKNFFENWTTSLTETHNEVRLLVIEKMMKVKRNMIMTVCYTKTKQETNIKNIIWLCKKYWYSLKYIHLEADKEILKKRVTNESRNTYSKLKDPDKLIKFLETTEVSEPVPFLQWHTINSSLDDIEKTMIKIKSVLNEKE